MVEQYHPLNFDGQPVQVVIGPNRQFKTFTDAIDIAQNQIGSPTTTVVITADPATYSESFSLPKNVYLVGKTDQSRGVVISGKVTLDHGDGVGNQFSNRNGISNIMISNEGDYAVDFTGTNEQETFLKNVHIYGGATGLGLKADNTAAAPGGTSTIRLEGWTHVWGDAANTNKQITQAGNTRINVANGYLDVGQAGIIDVPAWSVTGDGTIWTSNGSIQITGQLETTTNTGSINIGNLIITTNTVSALVCNSVGLMSVGNFFGIAASGAAVPAVTGAGAFAHGSATFGQSGFIDYIASTINGGLGPNAAAIPVRLESYIADKYVVGPTRKFKTATEAIATASAVGDTTATITIAENITEDISLPAGMHLKGVSDQRNYNVTISGSITVTGAVGGSTSISGLNVTTGAQNALVVNTATTVRLHNSTFASNGDDAILVNDAGANVVAYNISADETGGAHNPINLTNGTVTIDTFSNTAASGICASVDAGTLTFNNAAISGKVDVSGTGACNLFGSTVSATGSCLTTNSTGTTLLGNCSLVNAGGDTIDGAGVFAYQNVSFLGVGNTFASTLNGGAGADAGVVKLRGAAGFIFDSTKGVSATNLQAALDEVAQDVDRGCYTIGSNAQFASFADAKAQAILDGNANAVFILFEDLTENIVIPEGMTIMSKVQQGRPALTLTGSIRSSDVGGQLATNVIGLIITGDGTEATVVADNASALAFSECVLTNNGDFPILFSDTNGASVHFDSCQSISVAATAPYMDIDDGNITGSRSVFGIFAGSKIIADISAGALTSDRCGFQGPIVTSGTGGFTKSSGSINCASGAVPVTHNGTGFCSITRSSLFRADADSNVIEGTGEIQYHDLHFSGSSKLIQSTVDLRPQFSLDDMHRPGTIDLAAGDEVPVGQWKKLTIGGDGGNVTLTSTPSIDTDVPDGTEIRLYGTTNTVTIQDKGTLPGSAVNLPGGAADMELAENDIAILEKRNGEWFLISFADHS